MARPTTRTPPDDLRQGADLLCAWQLAQRYTQTEAAKAIGIPQNTYSQYCSGAMIPSDERRQLIEERTGGKVPASSWTMRALPKAQHKRTPPRKRATDEGTEKT